MHRFRFVRRVLPPRAGVRTRSVLSLVGIAVAMLLSLVVTTGVADAHAAYVSSNPAANTVLKTAPTTITITFAQNLNPQGLSIVVYGNKGDVVSTGTAQISSTDPKTASVTIKGDGSDIYRVDWNNVSAEDGDPTLGAFVFAVDPSGTSDKVASVAATSTKASTSSGVSVLAAILIGLAGLVVGAGVTYLGTRPRATPPVKS
jgi:methionine-rich copper-binding protein CopC